MKTATQTVKQLNNQTGESKMKTLNTAFKLLAISAAAMTLVACGGGGGGGSVASAPAPVVPVEWRTNPTLVYASADQTSAGNALFGADSDLLAVHAQGYTGQGTVMWTHTTNVANYINDGLRITSLHDPALIFKETVGKAAPGVTNDPLGTSHLFNNGNIMDTVNTAVGYTAFSTSVAQYNTWGNAIITNSDATMAGVLVESKSFTPTSPTPTYSIAARNVNNVGAMGGDERELKVKDLAANEVDVKFTFSDVNTGSTDRTKNADLGQAGKTAYLAGSAAVIQSKFNNLSNVGVVNYMATGADTNGVFKLGTVLAPRTLK